MKVFMGNIKNKKKNKGFTLMEVIVVIAILAILASVAVPTISGYIEEAKETSDLQVATNIVKATQNAVALNSSALPNDGIIEVIWATGYGPTSGHQNKLLVREVTNSGRESVLGKNYGTRRISSEALARIQSSIIESIDGATPTNLGQVDAYAILEVGKSKIAEENNFAIHINTGTGEVALAYHSVDGEKNIWINEIGVNIEPAK